ncbi:unnamed protein product [Lathyrus sativus]|nr:unnamed protein product [Lathyrus sativus]
MWRYNEGTYKLWIKILEIDVDFLQIRKDDDAYDFAAYARVNQVDGDIFIEHDVKNMKLKGRVQKMNELKKVNSKAWTWLMAVPTKCCCKRAFCFYPKCDVLMNNISESFNATILVASDKPILTMCEWIRTYLMNRLATFATKLDKWQRRFMPMPKKMLDKEVFNSGHWLLTWSLVEQFQVTHAFNT